MASKTLAVRPTRSSLLIAVLTVGLVGCTTRTPLRFDDAADLRTAVAAGDTVRIETRDGRVIKTKVVEVTEDSLVGSDATVRLDDILTIEQVQLSKGKTALAGLGTATVVAAVVIVTLLIVLLVSFDLPADDS